MANEDIGTIKCACGSTAAVRKNKKSALYYSCPCCGLIMPRLKGGQNYILDNATMYGPEGKPAVVVDDAPATPEIKPVEIPVEPKPAASSIPRGDKGRFFFEPIL